MHLFYTDHFELPLPDGHRFPMSKYRLLRQRIVESDLHQTDLLLVPPAATDAQLCLAHERTYVERVRDGLLTEAEIRRIGFPWSPAMVERSRRSSGATLAAARMALKHRVAVNMAGGTHHAMSNAGEGYCVFNDAAVTIRTLLNDNSIQRAAVIDCDVHQGNGTAEILGRDSNVFTFSIHGEKNFPLRKTPSHFDIDLPDGTTDEFYLAALSQGLDQVFQQPTYDLVIYLAGADPFEGDRLGRLNLSKSGLRQRDEMVLMRCRDHRIPVAIAMAGGYAPNVSDIVDIHAQTIGTAKMLFDAPGASFNPYAVG